MKTFKFNLLIGGLVLLCLNCTPEEMEPVGIPYQKQTTLEAEAMYTLSDVFVPYRSFDGKSAKEIRNAVDTFRTQLHEPQMFQWWKTDPYTQAFSIYMEANPEQVLVIHGFIGPDYWVEGDPESVWVDWVYPVGQTLDLDCPPSLRFSSSKFTQEEGKAFELELDLWFHEEETLTELEWFGETILVNQFETILKITLPVSRPSEKEFIPGPATIQIFGSVLEEPAPASPE